MQQTVALFFLSFLFIVLLGTASGSVSAAETEDPPKTSRTVVYIADVQGVVGVPLEEHVDRIFEQVGSRENALLVLKLNTPGGLVDSMSAIMTKIAEADYPVVVWVAPSGSRAASAGAFIVQAAHVSAMAPGTNIGAAHPVTGGGKDIDDKEMNRKVTNDLTAKMRSFAQERGRNVKVAESMVTESVSLTAREALDKKVIDLIAESEDQLLEKLNGRKIKIKGRQHVISLDNHELRRLDMPLRLRLLELFSRPDIAYLALIAGVFMIILEVRSPGGFVLGVSGGILLLIASYGLRVLPVNFAGAALLVGGIVIIAADMLVGGIGILTVTGIGAMLFGGLILYRAPGGELLHLSASFVVGVTLVIGILFLIILRLTYKALRQKPVSGQEGMIGRKIRITEKTDKSMMTFVHGEYWRVLPIDPLTDLEVGDEAEIVKVESLMLYVAPVKKKTVTATEKYTNV